MSIINIKDLDKAEVLAALYNSSKLQGMGFMQAKNGDMTTSQAQELLDSGQDYFDYLHGKVMKIDLSGDELETALYNRDNGSGAAERAISEI